MRKDFRWLQLHECFCLLVYGLQNQVPAGFHLKSDPERDWVPISQQL